jgi:hypothetical protein
MADDNDEIFGLDDELPPWAEDDAHGVPDFDADDAPLSDDTEPDQ